MTDRFKLLGGEDLVLPVTRPGTGSIAGVTVDAWIDAGTALLPLTATIVDAAARKITLTRPGSVTADWPGGLFAVYVRYVQGAQTDIDHVAMIRIRPITVPAPPPAPPPPPPPTGSAPVFVQPPTISGTAQVGQVLSSTNGVVTGDPTPAVTGQWERSDTGTSGWSPIPGSNALTHPLLAADEGKYLSKRALATNALGSAQERSNVLGPVVPAAVTVLPQTAMFSAQARPNEGGFQLFDTAGQPVAITGVTGTGLIRTWSAASGQLVFSGGLPGPDHGKQLTLSYAGGSVVVTIDAQTHTGETIGTWDEFTSLVMSPARFQGRSHVIRCRDYTVGGPNLFGHWQGTAGTLLVAERLDVRRPTFRVQQPNQFVIAGPGAGNFTMRGLRFFGVQDPSKWNPIDPAALGVALLVEIYGSNILMDQCRVGSDEEAASTGYLVQQTMVGLTLGGANNVFQDGEIDRICIPVRFQGTGCKVTRSRVRGISQDGANFADGAADNEFSFNEVLDFWGTGANFHQNLWQYNGGVNGNKVLGNVFLGTAGQHRPGRDCRLEAPLPFPDAALPVQTIIGNATLTLTQLNKGIYAATNGATMTLPDPATCRGDDIVLATDGAGKTATVTVANPAHSDILPRQFGFFNDTPALGVGPLGLRSDGTKWVLRSHGLRVGTQRRPAQNYQLVEQRHIGRNHRFATGGGQVTVTLPPAPTIVGSYNGRFYGIEPDDATGSIRVVSGDATPLRRHGQTISEFVITGMTNQQTVAWDGTAWNIEDSGLGLEGFLTNVHDQAGLHNFAGNIMFTNLTWSMHMGGSAAGAPDEWLVSYNSILHGILPPLSGDTITRANRGGLQFPMQGQVQLLGETSAATGNVIYGRVTDPVGGSVQRDNVELLYEVADSGNPAKMLTAFEGPAFNPTTIAEAIDVARVLSALQDRPRGAHAITDFAARRFRTDLSALTVSVVTPHNAGDMLELLCSYVPRRGTGNIVLWNVTDNVLHQTIPIGSCLRRGPFIRFTPTPMTAGKTYAVRIDASALVGEYGNTFAGVAGNALTVVPLPALTPFSRVANGGTRFLTRATALAIADSKQFTFGFRGRATGGSGDRRLLSLFNQSFDAVVPWNNSIGLSGTSPAPSGVFGVGTGADALSPGGPIATYLASVDLADIAKCRFFLNGQALALNPSTFIDSVIDFNRPGPVNVLALFNDGTQTFTGEIDYIYLAPTWLELNTAATRQLFNSATGMGANGQGPTGSQPPVYIHGTAAEWEAGTANKGNGGAFLPAGPGAFANV